MALVVLAFYLGAALDHLAGLHGTLWDLAKAEDAAAGAAATAGSSSSSGGGCQQAVLNATSLQLDFEGEALPPKCIQLRDVCADQQELVLMGPKYRPDAPQPQPLPSFNAVAKYNYPWRSEHNPDPLVREGRGKGEGWESA
jgi:hypothetical protein